MAYEEREVKRGEYIVSKTDTKGIIVNVNSSFTKISDYKESEVLGKPHKILRHSEMPKVVFALLWAKARAERDVNAFVKNRCKNGDFYWVFATVTPSYSNTTKALQGFYSVRKRAHENAISQIENLYKMLLDIERIDGINASIVKLKSILDYYNIKFNDLMNKLQSDSIELDLSII